MGISQAQQNQKVIKSNESNSNMIQKYNFSDQIAEKHQALNIKNIRNSHKQIEGNITQKSSCNQMNHKRVKQSLVFFIIHILIAAVISFQNIFIIYGVDSNYDNGVKIIISDLFFITIFSYVNSYHLVSFKTLILMYTLLDGILVAQIAAQIGLVGALLLVSAGTLLENLLMVMIPVSFFFFVGNFRVCLKFADWNREIIVYKIAILCGAVCFFQIGAYFMAVDYSYTKGMLQELDSKIKDFITLYAFGTFQFFLGLFGKICDFDQTSDFKYVYEFEKQEKSISEQQ